MIIQSILFDRILTYLVAQVWPIIYGPYFAYKLLKRARTRSTISLSTFFISLSVVFIIAFLSIIFTGTPYSKIIYSISLFIYMFIQGLLIMTIWFMTNITRKIGKISIILFLFCYLILASYVIYGLSTGWRPEFSWPFFWVSIFYVTFFLILPELFLAKKLLHEFKGLPMENRVKMFILGIFLFFLEHYFFLLYNTWTENLIYHSIHLIIAVPLTAGAAYLTYRGFGRSLK